MRLVSTLNLDKRILFLFGIAFCISNAQAADGEISQNPHYKCQCEFVTKLAKGFSHSGLCKVSTFYDIDLSLPQLIQVYVSQTKKSKILNSFTLSIVSNDRLTKNPRAPPAS